MKTTLCFFLALPFFVFSQNEKPSNTAGKGASPISTSSTSSTNSTTRAVVIGISDYQEKDIPDLRFADKDAEAFANFLRSPAGGSLDGDHLQILTNQNATAGRVAEALDGLIEQAKEGDEVIIYFSGHGDVEGKKISQPGFLLCWDSPSRVYMGGGTYSLSFLQEVVTTLSVQNKAKVLVITDACHAGKLAGNQIGGSQLTSANLAKQYANETKILSCQPNEFSLEGEQWGGGRGVFSYHLVDGLLGLADKNGDGAVSLFEIGRYLEDKVTAEAAPQSQIPMVLGNKTERLATVSAEILADLKKAKASGLPVFAATEGRGFEDEVLAKLDSGIVKRYFAFKKAVAEKRFFQPENDCAEVFYAKLAENGSLAPLHGFLKRNYAAALQDDAQQVLNEWLKTNKDASLATLGSKERLPQKVFTEKVKSFPRCLDRAAELLGSKHYMFAALKARRCFFEGYLLTNSNRNPDAALGRRVMALFRESLEWQPEQPQVFWQMSNTFGEILLQPDSLVQYARRAIALLPNWKTPCIDAAFLLSHKFGQPENARPFLEEASRIDSSSADVLHSWAVYSFSQKNFTEAELLLKKGLAMDSTNRLVWNSLGYLYTITGRHADAVPVLKKAISLDSTSSAAWTNLGFTYSETRQYAAAETALKKAVSLDSTHAPAWNNLGYFYNQARRYAEAEPVLKKAISVDPRHVSAWNNLGLLYLQTQRYAEAEPALKKGISLDSTHAPAWNNLGFSYLKTLRYAEAEPLLKKAISLDSTFANPCKHLGMTCFKTKRYDEARRNFLKAIVLNPNYAGAMLGMACLLFSEGKTGESLGCTEQAIGKGSTFEQLESDEDLAPLRTLPEWKDLMKKYFPEKVKD